MKQVSGRLRPTVPTYGVIAVKPAKQYPPAARSRALKCCDHPAKIGRISHRAVQSVKETRRLREVVALTIIHVFNVDVSDMFTDSFDVRALIGVAAVRHGPIEVAAGYAREGEKPLAIFGKDAGCERRDRRRIETAA